MTRIHAEIVIGAVLVLLALLWVVWKTDAPSHVQDAGRVLLAVMVVQGMIGYTQFFTHLPPVLVGVHVFGASVVWATALWFHHGLSDHQPELGVEPDPRMDGSEGEPTGIPVPDLAPAPVSGRDASREPV